MKIIMMKSLKLFLILVFSITLMSTAALADDPILEHPNIYFSGNFAYDVDTYQLSFSNFNIYNAESDEFVPYASSDSIMPLPFSTIAFGPLYNSAADPYSFGATSGTTDPVSFLIEDSAGTDHLSATLGNFVVENTNGAILKWGSIFDITKGSTGSQYLTDIGNNDLNLWLSFTGYTAVEAFTQDSTGNLQGNIQTVAAVSVVPEPVSTLLFITGGVVLALGRRFKKVILN